MTHQGRRSPLASASVARHLVRGVIGALAVAGAIVLGGIVGPVALVLVPVALLAWRGCPTCWAVGMVGTLADAREPRSCPRR